MIRIEQDEEFELFLCCVGFDHHCLTCKVCSSDDNGGDLCEDGEKILKTFLRVMNDWSYRIRMKDELMILRSLSPEKRKRKIV